VFRERTATSDRCSSARAEPPEGIHPDAGSQASLPTPAGATPAEVELGGRIFHGQVASAPCEGCHGTDARALPKGRISPAAGGCGAMAASHPLPGRSPMGCRNRRNPDPRCLHWEAPSSRNPSLPPSLPMCGRWAIAPPIDGMAVPRASSAPVCPPVCAVQSGWSRPSQVAADTSLAAPARSGWCPDADPAGTSGPWPPAGPATLDRAGAGVASRRSLPIYARAQASGLERPAASRAIPENARPREPTPGNHPRSEILQLVP
jgi:hypothetical protein